MTELESFIEKIEDFNSLTITAQIDYFILYLSQNNQEGVSSKEVLGCFNELDLKKYSNIPAYLSSNSQSKNKKVKFIKKKNGYGLERKFKQELEATLGIAKKPVVCGDLFSLEIVQNTRGYIENIAHQANACYEYSLYDASLVMIRKLLETLIIELFEKNKIEGKIKNSNDNYFYLNYLLTILTNETSWTLGRNTKTSLQKIKALGDLSAHNRRFCAKKADIDKVKDDLRIVVEELVHLISF